MGRHRAPRPAGRRAVVRLLAPIIAVAAVVLVVVVVLEINGHSSGNQPGPGVVTATTPSLGASLTPHATVSPTTAASTSPSAPAHTAKPPPAKPKPKPKPDQTAMAPVRVYNSTTITGLAHHVADEVSARGWTVIDVGNVRGASSLTTLYYAPGLKAAAQHLASEFASIRRVEPDSAARIAFTGLTLILTADWHD